MRFASSPLFPWLVIAAFFVAASLVVGCSCGDSHVRDLDAATPETGGDGFDAPIPMGDGGCSGTGPSMCVVCGGDAFYPPTCVGSAWMCPIGMTPIELCPPTCWGPPPGPDCRCDFSGPTPEWECEPAPGPAPCPAERRVGDACSLEGQVCGDSCCDTAAICRSGAWVEGPVANCAVCSSYACGPGSCRADQACASFGCPGDETCLPIPDDCTGCGCFSTTPDVMCVERDGHLFLYGGDCA